ncbi:MAG TPA: hypothetical protein VHZ76_00970 [Gammaproteobacteria bacterium]|nr:hypothetical protein [Gammaproteobacteria bacterium]
MMQQQSQMPSQTSPMPGSRFAQLGTSVNLPLDIVGGTAFGRYPKISNESTYNMIISDGSLVPFAGYELAQEISSGGQGREAYNSVLANLIIVVISNGVFTVSPQLVVQKVGVLETFNGNVYIADNLASQIAIVDGLNVYIYNYLNSTFQTITVDFAPVYITYQDTFFIAADGNTNQWRLSDNNDGTVWPPDAQHVGELQSKPCRTVATVALDRVLLVMGQTVTEPWYDAGLQLFPYARNNYYCIDYGCVSTQTIASGFGMAVWLASNQQSGLAIMVSQEGGPPTPISTDGLDFQFAQLTNPQNSYGMLFKLEGHICYMITFTTDNLSYLYDFNTNMFFSVTDQNLNHHIARRVVYFNGSNYFISFNDGNLYRMASTITDYNGASIPRIRICKNIRFPGGDRFIIQNVNLTMESGQIPWGAIPDSVADAPTNSVSLGAFRIDMNLSTDGGERWGYTWSKQLRNLGQNKNTVNFWKLGGVENDLVFKFRFVSQGRFIINGGTISLYK